MADALLLPNKDCRQEDALERAFFTNAAYAAIFRTVTGADEAIVVLIQRAGRRRLSPVFILTSG